MVDPLHFQVLIVLELLLLPKKPAQLREPIELSSGARLDLATGGAVVVVGGNDRAFPHFAVLPVAAGRARPASQAPHH